MAWRADALSGAQSETSASVERIRAFVALTKPRIIELLLITTIPTMFVARRGVPSVSLMVATLVGGTMAAGGANAFNMVIDRDIDRLMKRTQHRPLVTGKVTPAEATVFAALLEVGAFVELWLTANLLSAVLALSATAFYVGVYTLWLKRSSKQNIVIGGAAGAVPVLVGWSAVTGRLAWAPVLLFAVIVLWTPPHFWALAIRYRDDYRAADVPMLPAVATMGETTRQMFVYTVALVAASLGFVPLAHMGIVYTATAAVLGAVFLYKAARLGGNSTPRDALKLFHFSITYLTLLFVSIALDVVIHWH